MTAAEIKVIIASKDKHFEDGRTMFKAYASSLDFDLSFQGFEKELDDIKVQYDWPSGGLVLAYLLDKPIGCAGLRMIDEQISELKRMYILPEFQGRGIGKMIMELIIDIAMKLDYKKIKLDTLATMASAIHLYKSYGFVQTEPYRYNPFDNAVYMELELDSEDIDT
jgi:ribosomal protein S18 acetylase RimI-like enzyme